MTDFITRPDRRYPGWVLVKPVSARAARVIAELGFRDDPNQAGWYPIDGAPFRPGTALSRAIPDAVLEA